MPHDTELDPEEEGEESCGRNHTDELDEQTKAALTTFATIRGKVEDLARAESDPKRFELSIESERKRLQKNLESAKLSLRNARIQMAAELAKVDAAGFSHVASDMKKQEAVGG